MSSENNNNNRSKAINQTAENGSSSTNGNETKPTQGGFVARMIKKLENLAFSKKSASEPTPSNDQPTAKCAEELLEEQWPRLQGAAKQMEQPMIPKCEPANGDELTAKSLDQLLEDQWPRLQGEQPAIWHPLMEPAEIAPINGAPCALAESDTEGSMTSSLELVSLESEDESLENDEKGSDLSLGLAERIRPDYNLNAVKERVSQVLEQEFPADDEIERRLMQHLETFGNSENFNPFPEECDNLPFIDILRMHYYRKTFNLSVADQQFEMAMAKEFLEGRIWSNRVGDEKAKLCHKVFLIMKNYLAIMTCPMLLTEVLDLEVRSGPMPYEDYQKYEKNFIWALIVGQ